MGLLEREIEDHLWTYPEVVSHAIRPINLSHWLARQVCVPSGVIDLIGVCRFGAVPSYDDRILIVELKRNQITSDTLTQVSRYAADAEIILDNIMDGGPLFEGYVMKLVIGSGINDKVFAEAKALGIMVVFHKPDLSLSRRLDWAERKEKEIYRQHENLARTSPAFNYVRTMMKPVYLKHIERLATSQPR